MFIHLLLNYYALLWNTWAQTLSSLYHLSDNVHVFMFVSSLQHFLDTVKLSKCIWYIERWSQVSKPKLHCNCFVFFIWWLISCVQRFTLLTNILLTPCLIIATINFYINQPHVMCQRLQDNLVPIVLAHIPVSCHALRDNRQYCIWNQEGDQ